MPNFRYVALDPTGKRLTKVVTAASKQEVTDFLNRSKFFIVQLTEVKPARFNLGNQLTTNEKVSFTQNISVLLTSGISLGEAMEIMIEDTNSKKAEVVYRTIQSDLEQGLAFSKALAHHPQVFDPIFISLVEAGENSGELAGVMANLSKSIEKDLRTVSQVKSALLYPLFILGSLFALGGMLVFFVLPRITKVFEQLNVKLPITTRMLIAFSNITTKYPIPILISMVIIVATIFFASRSRAGKQFFGFMALKLPVIRDIIRNVDLSRLSATLALLLNAGVPIQQALRIASGTVKNPRLNKELSQTSEKLANGISLGRSLEESSLPKTFVALVTVGERSGQIATIFTSLGNHYEDQLDTALKNFTSLLEPMLTLLVGLLVGGVVITIMVPIYQFVGNLSSVQ